MSKNEKRQRGRLLPSEEKELKEKIESILEEIRVKAGHKLINELYRAQKEIHKHVMPSKHFPISLLYRYSLMHELKYNPAFAQMTTRELAKHEGISLRSAYRMRQQLYRKKRLL